MEITRQHPGELLADKDVPPAMRDKVADVSDIYVREDFRTWVRIAFWRNNTLTNSISARIPNVRVYSLFLSYLFTGCQRERFHSMLRFFFVQHLHSRRSYLEALLVYVSYRDLFPLGSDITLPNIFLAGKDDDNLRLLLEHGYLVDKLTESGDTPLFCAVTYESVFTIRLLVQYGANVNYRDNRGRTLLQLACLGGNATIVKLLLTCGANPHCLSEEGYTTLTYAVRGYGVNGSNVGIISVLLQFPVDANALDLHGNTTLDWLTELTRRSCKKILPLLLRAGARPENMKEANRRYLLLHYANFFSPYFFSP